MTQSTDSQGFLSGEMAVGAKKTKTLMILERSYIKIVLPVA